MAISLNRYKMPMAVISVDRMAIVVMDIHAMGNQHSIANLNR